MSPFNKTPVVSYHLPLDEFEMFLKVDRGLNGETLKDYVRDAKKFLDKCGLTFDKNEIRMCLAPLTLNMRRKTLASLKQLYRFVDRFDVLEGFKSSRCRNRIVRVPQKNN